MSRNYHQGEYEIKNWDKYAGTKNPRFLSSYEKYAFEYFDRSPAVIKWGAELVVVEYYNPVKQRKARYIVDIYVKYKDKNGVIREELIEIKPHSQTVPPTRGKGKRSEATFLTESMTWAVNSAKWAAAQKYAEERGWRFGVLTEKSLFR